MKLHATIKNEKYTTASKGGNLSLSINLKIGNKEVGNLVMRNEEVNDKIEIYYYPITATTGRIGKTLLHRQKVKS